MTKPEFDPTPVQCKKCGDILVSSYPGEFISCKCHSSFVDQTPHYGRYGGCIVRVGEYEPPIHTKLVQHMGDDLTVVNAARVSYDTKSTGLESKDIKLIAYLAKHQHMTPFEHTSATFEITCTMPIAMQIMRHRTFSYNQVSRRYTSEAIDVVHPNTWRKQGDPDTGNKQGSHGEIEDPLAADFWFHGSTVHALTAYNNLIELGVCREQARMVLPQALETKFWMTGNLRNWSHFLQLRLDSHAQKEVQDISKEILQGLLEVFPYSIKALIKEESIQNTTDGE